MVLQCDGDKAMIDWQNPDSIWFAEPTNHRLVPDGGEYGRYLFVKKFTPSGSRVLDVGCNCGQVAQNLTEDLGCEVVGIDIVPEFIEHCQERKQGVFICADFCEMSREDLERLGTFDVVTALELIEHPTVSMRKFRDNVGKVLRPGGRLILTTPHPRSEHMGYQYMREHVHHNRMWTVGRLQKVFGPLVAYDQFYRPGDQMNPGLAYMGAVFQR